MNRRRFENGFGSGARRFPSRLGPSLRAEIDLVACSCLMIVAAATTFLPPGNWLRLVLALPILLVVPGYLAIQAVIVPAAPPRTRLVHALVGVGLSPAAVGLIALTTSMASGGFRTTVIVVAVTVGSIMLAVFAAARRLFHNPHRARARSKPSDIV